jgi:hypothetical protein
MVHMGRDREQPIAFPNIGGPLKKERSDPEMDPCPLHITHQAESCFPDAVMREAIPYISEMFGYVLEECGTITS